MTLEQALLAALTTVTGALMYVVKELWSRSVQCEKDRVDMRIELEALKQSLGQAIGELTLYRRCKAPACPFSPAPTQQAA